ncbi:uncharacterized protein PAF06_009312 [Gastrophryne carolinensis]
MTDHHHASCCSWTPGPDHHHHFPGVTFVLGALDGDPVKLSLLKEYVCDALNNLVHIFRATSFNVIYFSRVIRKWCDCVVTWSLESAAQAVSWIQGLSCGSGTGPTDALIAAFEDPMCHAVYLVMDALPPRVLSDIYHFLARNESTCAVNAVYLLEELPDSQAEGFFREINLKPFGSSHMESSTVIGCLAPMWAASEDIVPATGMSCPPERRQPIAALDSGQRTKIKSHEKARSHFCMSPSVSSVCHHDHRPSPFTCSRTFKESPGTCSFNLSHVPVASASLSLHRGARVLARRDLDGLFYMGHIAQEAEGSTNHFLVAFDKCQALKGKAQFRMQETSACDIIHYEDARWRPLVPGDHVLAPIDTNMEKYGPGTILRGTERRERGLAFDNIGVLVTFWNGKTKQIAAGLSIWIPQDFSDRITLELHIPLEARKKLMESCPSFPFIGTNYKHPECQAKEAVTRSGSHKCLYCSSSDVCQRCHVPAELWAALRHSLNHLSNMNANKEKTSTNTLSKEENLKQYDSINTVSGKEKTKPVKRTIAERRGYQQPEQYLFNKEQGTCTRDTQTEVTSRSLISPTNSLFETQVTDDRVTPSYKQSSLRHGGMTHLQATLHSINQSMKEDRKAMESALLEQRPRSTTLKLNYEAKARSNQQVREQKEAEKDIFWRMQGEERQKRREEKVKEMEQQKLALQDNRRLRSEQRILLDLERRHDQEGLEAQQAESRKVMAGERMRKNNENLEKEQRKEEDRMKFWRDLRQQREDVDARERWTLHEQEEMKKDLAQSQRVSQQRQQEAELQEWRRHQELQSGSQRRVSQRLEQFYRQAKQESEKDKDLQKYLKEHNLQMLRSSMLL